MYDPAVQRAVLEKLARWRRLPEGDLIGMLSAVERLRFRPEALDDLVWDGLIAVRELSGVGGVQLSTFNITI